MQRRKWHFYVAQQQSVDAGTLKADKDGRKLPMKGNKASASNRKWCQMYHYFMCGHQPANERKKRNTEMVETWFSVGCCEHNWLLMFNVIGCDWLLSFFRASSLSFHLCFRRKSSYRLVFNATAAKEKAKIANSIYESSDLRAWEAVPLPEIFVASRSRRNCSWIRTVKCAGNCKHF